jgi:hypothetical protein
MSAEICEPIRRLVAAAPPLTPDQLLKLAVLLRPDLPVGIRNLQETRRPKRTRATP